MATFKGKNLIQQGADSFLFTVAPIQQEFIDRNSHFLVINSSLP